MPSPREKLPFVSVIIPCYNAQRTIQECLESVLSQDYPSYEIIVVDDGSTDSSKEIVSEYLSKGSLRMFTQPNQGAGAARNTAFRKAQGNIFLLLDSDAKVFPGWIHSHVMEQQLAKKVVGGSVIPWNDTFAGLCDYYSTWYEYYPQKKPGKGRYQISSTNLSLAREVVEKTGYFDPSIRGIEDAEYTHRITTRGFTIYFNPSIPMAHHDRDDFKGFLKHHYWYGYNAPVVRTKESGTRFNWIMPRHSWTAFLMILPLTVMHTGFTLYHWLPARPDALLFFPFIFVGKLAHSIGIYHGIRDREKRKTTTQFDNRGNN